jgi:hypothetical protein
MAITPPGKRFECRDATIVANRNIVSDSSRCSCRRVTGTLFQRRTDYGALGTGPAHREVREMSLFTRKSARAQDGGIFADLRPNAANFAPLTPVSFLPRSAAIHPERVAVIHGVRRYNYRQLYDRARQLASALAGAGGALLGFAALAALFYLPQLLGVATFPDGDFTHHFLPFSLFQQEELLAARLPVWNPYTYGGHPRDSPPFGFLFQKRMFPVAGTLYIMIP